MKYDVFKIGGSILTSAKSYIDVALYIKKISEKKKLIIVVSASKGMTDLLIEFYDKNNKNALNEFIERYQNIVSYFNIPSLQDDFNKLINELLIISKNAENYDIKIRDKVLSFGEKISKLILYHSLKINDLNANPLNADEIIITDNRYGDAFIDISKTMNNLKNLNKDIYLIEGFIGKSYENNVTTLGRGGSDYTASALSYILKSDNLFLITDVKGIYSSDPRIVKNVKIVKKLDFEEAIEASIYNVKGINYKTFYPLINSNVNVYIGKLGDFNTLVNNSPNYNEKVKIFGFKNDNENKTIGLIGKGMNKDFIIKGVYKLFNGNYKDIIINRNGERPSIYIKVKTNDIQNFVNSLHDELIGDNI